MNRGQQGMGRGNLSGAGYGYEYDQLAQGGRNYHDPPLRESFLGNPSGSRDPALFPGYMEGNLSSSRDPPSWGNPSSSRDPASFESYRGRSPAGGRDPSLFESYGDSSSYRGQGRESSYDLNFEESLRKERALQQELSLRESQLMLASSLLMQQEQQQNMISHRGQPPHGFQPGNRGGRGSNARGRNWGTRIVSGSQRYPNAPRGRGIGRGIARGSGRGIARGSGRGIGRGIGRGQGGSPDGSRKFMGTYSPGRPTMGNEAAWQPKRTPWCSLCNKRFSNKAGLVDHKASKPHIDKVASIKTIIDPKSSALVGEESKPTPAKKFQLAAKKKGCVECDIPIFYTAFDYLAHQTSNKHIKGLNPKVIGKRQKTVMKKGCSLCHITYFYTFIDVQTHRASKKHQKRVGLLAKEMEQTAGTALKSKPQAASKVQQETPKLELPPELIKYDATVVVGQKCVVPATGWYCRVCKKYYNMEKDAKDTHCRTEIHFNNFRKYTWNQLKKRAGIEAKRQAKAEEQKKKAAETAAEKKEEGEETMEVGEDAANDDDAEVVGAADIIAVQEEWAAGGEEEDDDAEEKEDDDVEEKEDDDVEVKEDDDKEGEEEEEEAAAEDSTCQATEEEGQAEGTQDEQE